jgi:type IV pilus assembly protein PilW
MTRQRQRKSFRQREGGMTLIELMVALVISMVLSLAVFVVMSTFEGRRRTLGSGADLDQAGSVAMFQIDRWVRSAGTGFAQSSAYAYGCPLYATKTGVGQLLPRAAALPAPFASVDPGASGVFRLAPVLILPGQTAPGASNASTTGHTSDVLVLMSAGASNGNIPTAFSAAAVAGQLNLVNTVPFTANDMVLLTDRQPASTGGVAPCLLTQAASTVSGGAASAMALGGTWYGASVDTVSLIGYSDTGVAIDLGNPVANLPPSFQLLGVGDHNTLYSYDLLQTSDIPLQARAEGVFEMHALYGVDTDANGKVDSWVKPEGSYSVAALSAGTSTAAALLKTIKEVRVGLILRTALPEKDVVNTSTTLTLFSDLGSSLAFTRALDSTEQHYRYRAVEATIPLRNNFL